MVKKSYNPFEMWGSYVGLISGPILLKIFTGTDILTFIQGLFIWNSGGYIKTFAPLFWLILIIGVLIGWGIHSLFRRLK